MRKCSGQAILLLICKCIF